MFAKLYETQKHGQILVMLDSDTEESTPEVRFFVQPKGLGVCSFAMGFEDSQDGWENAETAFEKVDEAMALKVADSVFDRSPLAATDSGSDT